MTPSITSLNITSASPVLKTPLKIIGSSFGTNATRVKIYVDS